MPDVIFDVGSVKNRLVQYRENNLEIDRQIERIERMQNKLEGVGAQVISDMPRAASPSNDRLTFLMSQKIDLENIVHELIEHQASERKFFEEAMKGFRHSEEKAVIRMRYFDGVSWEGVAEMMFGSHEDYEDKVESYIRRVHRIHGTALYELTLSLSVHEE